MTKHVRFLTTIWEGGRGGAPGTPHCHQEPSLRLVTPGFMDPGKKKPEAQGLGSGFY